LAIEFRIRIDPQVSKTAIVVLKEDSVKFFSGSFRGLGQTSSARFYKATSLTKAAETFT